MKRSAVVLALLASTALSPYVIDNDQGGFVADYQRRLARMDAEGRQIVIRGDCVSACVVYLRARNVCVYPTARLGFHAVQPYSDQGKFTFALLLPSAFIADYILDWGKRRRVTYITGREAIRRGVKEC